jgi:dTDP-4-amino-4,6-dideoxygalactose transaminase
VDKFTWVDIGSSYVVADILAAFLFGQLEQCPAIQDRRRAIWEQYDAGLRDWCATWGVRQPVVPAHCEQPFHMYYLLLPSLEKRQALITYLRERGIQSVFHYLPLHLSDMGRQFGGQSGQCPVTEDVSDRLLRLPFYNTLDEATQARVIEEVKQFKP